MNSLLGIQGTLLSIATRATAKAPMQEVFVAHISILSGVNRDTRGKQGPRQVTVITRAAWEAACAEVGVAPLPWTLRRANLLIDGPSLQGCIGYELEVGDALLTITGETRPCERMNEAQPGLMRALKSCWRGGVTCRVIRSGDIAVGCPVRLRRNLVRRIAWWNFLRLRPVVTRCRRFAGGLARRLGLRKDARADDNENAKAEGRRVPSTAYGRDLFLLPCAWDVASARVFEAGGFRAVGPAGARLAHPAVAVGPATYDTIVGNTEPSRPPAALE